MNLRWILSLGLTALLGAAALADDSTKSFDWPQWQGVERTAVSKETGLLPQWDKGGPPLAWKAENLGGGYSAPAVAGGRVVGMGYLNKEEIVWALSEENGKELWKTVLGPANDKIGYNQGPRCTPAVDGDHLYALGVSGDLVCLEAKTGKKVWTKNFVKDFGGSVPRWGYSESPLVDGKWVLATPGGKDAAIVAFDKLSGDVVWKAKVPGNDPAGYASIIAATLCGKKQYIQFTARGVVSVAAEDGAFLWRWDKPANNVSNISTVVVADNQVFASSAYNAGSGLVTISKKGDGTFEATQVYFDKKGMQNHHGGILLLDGYLYGADGGNAEGDRTPLICVDWKTGTTKWRAPPGKGSIAFADGRIYYRLENGPMVLIEPNPEAYKEVSRFDPPDRSREKAWAHPVIANGKLYLRDQGVLLAYNIKKK